MSVSKIIGESAKDDFPGKPIQRNDLLTINLAIHFYADGGPAAAIRALDEAGFVIVRKGLHQSLRRMVKAFTPFTSKPMGAPYSQMRIEQDEQVAAHAEAKALAYPKGHLRPNEEF